MISARIIFAAALASIAVNLHAADSDGDGIHDNVDNCTLIANADQRDTNGDEFGNVCDPDFNDDGNIDFQDLGALKAAFFEPGDLDEDLNGDGAVNFLDLAVMKAQFFGAPGPSGAADLASLQVSTSRVFNALAFNLPLGLLQAPDDASQWYVLEQPGFVRVFANQPNVMVSQTFVDISDRAECCFEGGLLGMAFHPDFPEDPRVFLSYTADGPNFATPLISILAEFVTVDGGLTLDPDSERVILSQDQPFTNHNGGHISFGPDGYLYFSLGDGGSGGDPINSGQTKGTWLGSLLRIDIDVSQEDRDAGVTYYVPPDNPFAANAACTVSGCPEIYAYGLRNTWRWSFDAADGTLWAGDVGQNQIEEIDVIVNGGNYGWRCYEGNNPYNVSGCAGPSEYIFPVATYNHSVGLSVTGGFVYRGAAQPGLAGVYFYADYSRGILFGLNSATRKPLPAPLLDTPYSISSFGEAQDGELYFLDYNNGGIYSISAAAQ